MQQTGSVPSVQVKVLVAVCLTLVALLRAVRRDTAARCFLKWPLVSRESSAGLGRVYLCPQEQWLLGSARGSVVRLAGERLAGCLCSTRARAEVGTFVPSGNIVGALEARSSA